MGLLGLGANQMRIAAPKKATVTMPKTLKGTMHLAEHGIEQNRAVRWTREQLNAQYLDRLSISA